MRTKDSCLSRDTLFIQQFREAVNKGRSDVRSGCPDKGGSVRRGEHGDRQPSGLFRVSEKEAV